MKIAIVTGASSGMGREMVFRLADRYGGFQEIWVIGRRKERLDALDGKVPVKLRKFPLDLTKKEDLEILAAALAEKKPEVKFLVNAAGFGITGPVGSFPEEEAASMVRLNCEGLTAVTELVLPYIPDNSHGLYAPAGIRCLCGHQGLCLKLQPGAGRGAKAEKDLCHRRVPRPCGYGVFWEGLKRKAHGSL